MRHTISVLVENKFGVLARVAGMFSGRGFNIHSLNVAPTHDRSLSRITVVAMGDSQVLDQITKQLNKLIDVIEVEVFRPGEYVQRELMLVKISVDQRTRGELVQLCDIFRAKIVSVTHDTMVLEVTGDGGKINAFIEMIQNFEILELARTGRVGLDRYRVKRGIKIDETGATAPSQ